MRPSLKLLGVNQGLFPRSLLRNKKPVQLFGNQDRVPEAKSYRPGSEFRRP